jgi:hypothetical protein
MSVRDSVGEFLKEMVNQGSISWERAEQIAFILKDLGEEETYNQLSQIEELNPLLVKLTINSHG